MWHSVTISFSNILNQKQKLDNFKINIFASKYEPVCCTVGAFDISRLDSVFVCCWNTKRFAVIKAAGNYRVGVAITYMFEVGCIVEVSDVDARSRGWMGSLHWDQFGQFHPPELSLGWRTEKWFMLLKILTRRNKNYILNDCWTLFQGFSESAQLTCTS